MYEVNDNDIVKLGNYLEQIRKEKGLRLQDVASELSIDIGSISRMEQGIIKKPSSLILKSLAKLYEVNVLSLYNMIGYTDDIQIVEYSEILSKKTEPIEIEDINNRVSFVVLPFLENTNNLKGINLENNNTVIYNKSIKLSNRDLGLFKINDQDKLSYYYENGDSITLQDYFTNEIRLLKKHEINCLGKVVSIINKFI